jgi:hypothetical protein
MPDSAFSHKCTPILNLSKKGVRGEKPDRGKQMAHRTHRVRTVRQENASTMVFDKCFDCCLHQMLRVICIA